MSMNQLVAMIVVKFILSSLHNINFRSLYYDIEYNNMQPYIELYFIISLQKLMLMSIQPYLYPIAMAILSDQFFLTFITFASVTDT